MIPDLTFKPFPKIHHLFRKCLITEKIDGTNAQVLIVDVTNEPAAETFATPQYAVSVYHDGKVYYILAGSRNRWLTPADDNFGFCRFVRDNAEKLVELLGPGRHYGEWFGRGIQRGYDMTVRAFGLFNQDYAFNVAVVADSNCVCKVPLLYRGEFSEDAVRESIEHLKLRGNRPEGVVVYFPQSNTAFKYTFDGDGHKNKPKSSHDEVPMAQLYQELEPFPLPTNN